MRSAWARSDALNKITWMVICKGGLVSDITVGDCLELTAALEEHHFRGSAGRPLFYALLKDTGVLPAGAPSRLRALRIEGRRSVAQIVDGYGIQCRPVRDLLVEYFTERAPSWTIPRCGPSPRNLCRLFWRDLEIHHPGIELAPAGTAGRAGMEGTSGLHPGRRRPAGAAPGQLPQRAGIRPGLLRGHRPVGRRRSRPVGAVGGAEPGQRRRVHDEEVQVAGQVADGPADPDAAAAAARAAAGRRAATQGRPRSGSAPPASTPAGGLFTIAGQEFQRCRQGPSGRVYVTELATGKRRNLTHEDEAAFWSWATVEVLRAHRHPD